MHRLYSNILSFNEHEIVNVHEKCGYKFEGKLVDHVLKNGEYCDVIIMGITVDMWEEMKPSFSYERIDFEE